jgi:hypothetical protein
MKSGFIVYLKDSRKKQQRREKQYVMAVSQTVKEGREVSSAALVNAR